ncbi:unnamed protein product, partial [marine sediment metagenome]
QSQSKTCFGEDVGMYMKIKRLTKNNWAKSGICPQRWRVLAKKIDDYIYKDMLMTSLQF